MSKPMTTLAARTLSVSIPVDAEAAYRLLAVPGNFPRWASGLADSLREVDGRWWAQTPEGPAEVRFSNLNAHGVLDHWVHFGNGLVVYVPLRVIANADGCELMLTLFRQPGMSDDKYEADAAWVMRDLSTAKAWLEAEAG